MGTITITAAGFSNLPTSAPSGWPSDVVYPASGATNGTKTYTVSDADWVTLITWAADMYFSGSPPPSPTGQTILLAWVQGWVNATKNAIQQKFTPQPVPPAQIGMS